MINKLAGPERALADYMSALSEKAYYASWMEGLEYVLWEAALNERQGFGRLQFTEQEREELRRLSAECMGWIIFDEKEEEIWISKENWERHFAEWQNSGKRIDG